MRWLRQSILALPVTLVVACGGSSATAPVRQAGAEAPRIDPATAATLRVTVRFDGARPKPATVRLDADPKCVTEAGATDRPVEDLLVGDGGHLRNVFVYVKAGLGRHAFPAATDPVVLDQKQCRYEPRVFGVRLGQPLVIHNTDPLLHNVRADAQFNQPFNMGQPQKDTSFTRTFSTTEVMVPITCDVHPWMRAWAGVVDHPFYGVSDGAAPVSLAGLPPGTYTIEAWHETLGAKTTEVTVGPKDRQDVTLTFSR